MRVAEFEQAIDTKGARIMEMRLHHNHVRQAIGRKDDTLIIWDDQGQARSTFMPQEMDDEIAMEQMHQYLFERAPQYDLDF